MAASVEYPVERLVKECVKSGYARFIFRSDQEPAILALKRRTAAVLATHFLIININS